MNTQRLRWLALMLTALNLSMAFCHLLEMGPRRGWSSDLWVDTTITGNLYRAFGKAGPGPWIELGSVLVVVFLAISLKRIGSSAFWPTAIAATLLVSAQVTWWLFVFPVNADMATWLQNGIPSNWTEWRDQWEFAHAARAVMMMVAFGSVAGGIVSEISEDIEPQRGPKMS